MTEVLFILNPAAASGKTSQLEEFIVGEMKNYNIDYKIRLTKKPLEAIDIVVNSPVEKIISVGGDGTINEIATGILKRGFGVLGIIPAGTGNDLSRSLKIPVDPKEALEKALEKDYKYLNVCRANDKPYLNIASIGFDANVVKNSEKFKSHVNGSLAYLLSAFYTLMTFKKQDVNISIDGKSSDVDMILLAVGNGSYYGGGFHIMPDSDLSDGNLHACIVDKASKARLVTLFPSIFRADHLKYTKYVNIYKAKEIVIRSDEEMFFNLDGEILDGGNKVVFKIDDERLKVVY